MWLRMRSKGEIDRGFGRGLLGGGVAMFGKKVGLPESRRMTYTVQFQEIDRLSKSRSTAPVNLPRSLFVVLYHDFTTTKSLPTRQFFVNVLQPRCHFRSRRWSTKAALGFDRLR